MKAKTISAAQFKEKCLAILDEVGPEGIVVAKHGKPVAKLIAIGSDSTSSEAWRILSRSKVTSSADILLIYHK